MLRSRQNQARTPAQSVLAQAHARKQKRPSPPATLIQPPGQRSALHLLQRLTHRARPKKQARHLAGHQRRQHLPLHAPANRRRSVPAARHRLRNRARRTHSLNAQAQHHPRNRATLSRHAPLAQRHLPKRARPQHSVPWVALEHLKQGSVCRSVIAGFRLLQGREMAAERAHLSARPGPPVEGQERSTADLVREQARVRLRGSVLPNAERAR